LVSTRSFRYAEQIPFIPAHFIARISEEPHVLRRRNSLFDLGGVELTGGGRKSSSDGSSVSDTSEASIGGEGCRARRVNLLCSGRNDIASMILSTTQTSAAATTTVDNSSTKFPPV